MHASSRARRFDIHRIRVLPITLAIALALSCASIVLLAAPRRADAATTRTSVLSAAAHWGSSHGYHVGISVYDTSTGQHYDAGAARSTFASESLIKALIAARLLLAGRMHGSTAHRAYYMITHSDDSIASSLYQSAGGDRLVSWMAHHYHVKNLGSGPSRTGWWGNNHLMADGLATLYAKFKADHRVGPWLINAMHHATKYGSDGTYQWFGLHSANSHAAIKQGWGADYDDWSASSDFNTTGFVDGDRYAVVILARGPYSRYGKQIGNALTTMARMILPHGAFPAGIPAITAMSTHATSTLGGRTVTLRGRDFSKVTSVTFGGVRAKSWHVVSSTQINVVTAAHKAAAKLPVRVVTSHGTSNGSSHMWFNPPPAIRTMNTTSGPTGGGTTVRITGGYFYKPLRVTFGRTAARSVKVLNGSVLEAVSPASHAGLLNVHVTTPYGPSPMVKADLFRYVAAPSVSSVSPNSGPKAGGTQVTVTGTGFTPGVHVAFGGTAASSVTVVSATELQVTAPAVPQAGVLHLHVTNAYGASVSNDDSKFTYTAVNSAATDGGRSRQPQR